MYIQRKLSIAKTMINSVSVCHSPFSWFPILAFKIYYLYLYVRTKQFAMTLNDFYNINTRSWIRAHISSLFSKALSRFRKPNSPYTEKPNCHGWTQPKEDAILVLVLVTIFKNKKITQSNHFNHVCMFTISKTHFSGGSKRQLKF